MKILYLFNKGLMTPDFVISLIEYGFDVVTIENYECPYDLESPDCRNKIEEVINANDFSFVISYNFIPSAAFVCNKHNLIYVSWMYDAFLPTLYTEYTKLPCNRIFVFDSQELTYLKSLGIQNVFYLPLCVNSNRLSELIITEEDKANFSTEVSMIGKLYCSDGVNGYNQIKSFLNEETIINIENAISGISGNWNLEKKLLDELSFIDYTSLPKIESNCQPKDRYIMDDNLYYNSLCFSRAITRLDRTSILNALADKFDTTIFTYEKPIGLSPNVKVRDGVSYLDEMPKIFNLCKINLNITLRSILSGIPLRGFDVIGAGGFLMTNKQEDFDMLFIDGIDYVSFSSIPDLIDKTQYYLEHEHERNKIAQNGYEKVCNYHSFENRIDDLLKTLLKNGLSL